MLSSSSRSPEFSQKSLKIKQNDKLSRLLSNETSLANPSFRVYYGNVSGAVPFTWEIQPGTPKHRFSDNSIPPLTPPPSYSYISDRNNKPTNRRKFYTRSKLLNILFLKIKPANKNRNVAASTPSSLSSASWSSSMSSSTTVPMTRRRRRFMSFGSSFDDGCSVADDKQVYGGGSPDSMVCFGMKKEKSGGGCTVVIMKKTLLSIVGCGSG